MNLLDCCSVTLDLKEAEDEVAMTFVAEMSSKLVPWWCYKLQVAISPVPMHVKEFA